jgi:hypothetical protein
MTLDGRELTIEANQSAPSPLSISHPAGGSWPAGTFSYKVGAWHWQNEGHEDYDCGITRESVSAWEGIVVSANDKLTIAWNRSNTIPDHYSVYYIENATYNNGTGGVVYKSRKIAEVDGDVETATIEKPFLQQGASTNVVGTQTGADSNTVLIDSAATFQTDGVKAGDSISNVTDGSTATVVTVDSEIQITTDGLTGGGDNLFQAGDSYRVTSTTLLVDTSATFISNGVEAGHYVILNAGASTPGAYAKIFSVDSETQLTTYALSDSASFFIGDSYDVVLKVEEFSLEPESFVMNPINDFDPTGIRQTANRGYNGRITKKSYAIDSPLDAVRVIFYPISLDLADLKLIAMWIYHGVRIRITDSANADPLIPYYDGVIVKTNILPTKYKNAKRTGFIDVTLELGTIT